MSFVHSLYEIQELFVFRRGVVGLIQPNAVRPAAADSQDLSERARPRHVLGGPLQGVEGTLVLLEHNALHVAVSRGLRATYFEPLKKLFQKYSMSEEQNYIFINLRFFK